MFLNVTGVQTCALPISVTAAVSVEIKVILFMRVKTLDWLGLYIEHAQDTHTHNTWCSTSLMSVMKRLPKRQGLWRLHWSELTVIWGDCWTATATTCTASYIRAASVWRHKHTQTHTHTHAGALRSVSLKLHLLVTCSCDQNCCCVWVLITRLYIPDG